jgi:hypothetical protein
MSVNSSSALPDFLCYRMVTGNYSSLDSSYLRVVGMNLGVRPQVKYRLDPQRM